MNSSLHLILKCFNMLEKNTAYYNQYGKCAGRFGLLPSVVSQVYYLFLFVLGDIKT